MPQTSAKEEEDVKRRQEKERERERGREVERETVRSEEILTKET